jgi:hypothetical protein
MILHQNKELFVNYIRITALQMKIPAIYVEKDYWVTYALFTTELLSQERFFSHLGITKTQNLEKKEI